MRDLHDIIPLKDTTGIEVSAIMCFDIASVREYLEGKIQKVKDEGKFFNTLGEIDVKEEHISLAEQNIAQFFEEMKAPQGKLSTSCLEECIATVERTYKGALRSGSCAILYTFKDMAMLTTEHIHHWYVPTIELVVRSQEEVVIIFNVREYRTKK